MSPSGKRFNAMIVEPSMANILLVDDDPYVLEALSITLMESGHHVTTARNGNFAIEHADSGQFDLVITDILMPDKEGLETISYLRRNHPELRIIAISGGARVSSTQYLNMAKAMGAEQALAKPFSASELLAAVEGN